MKNVTFSLVLLLAALCSFAQQPSFKGKITGMVVDQNQKIVEFATVALLKAADSTLVKGSLTDANGRYELAQIPAGSYKIRISQMGFKTANSLIFKLNSQTPTLQLAPIFLQEGSQTLAEVKVTAAKPFIEQQLDKTVVNVENSIVAAGNTALEVLEKAPGVTVDQNGNISLKGKSAVLVLIDGKQTYMSANDLANFLRNTQASQMEKIEIMTNPPAKYEAAGNAGVLNIRLKKNQNLGMNGSVNAGVGQGRYGKTNGGISLNYRNEKMNIFGSLNGRYNRNFQDIEVNRAISQKTSTGRDTMVYFDGIASNIRVNQGVNFRLGADYFLTKKTTLGILLTGNDNVWRSEGPDNLIIADANRVARQRVITYNDTRNTYQALSGNFNLKHTFDTTGRELAVDVDVAQYFNPSKQRYDIDNFLIFGADERPNGTTKLFAVQRSQIDILSGKIDYVHPINKTTKLETGWKSSRVKSDNDIVFSTTEGGEAIQGRSNRFIYTESINALYASLSKEWGKTSVQVGLRMEHTHGVGDQRTTRASFVRDTVNFFSTFFVRRELSKNHTLGFSFSQRIDRPSYEDLNPFIYFLNEYTFQKGNPWLRPQYTNSFELTHAFMGAINTTMGYSNTSGAMNEVFKSEELDGRLVTYVTRDNVARFQSLSLTVSFPLPVAKWLSSNNFIGVYHNRFTGTIATINEPIDTRGTTFNINSQNNITLPKGFALELSGFYQSGIVEGQLIGRSMGQVTLGIQKKVLEKRGTLRFNVSDIFATQVFRGSFDSPTVKTSIVNQWETRVARVSFSYRFGNNKVQNARQRTTGLEEEKSRVKNQ
jgi:iron complex outermembrane recepter protein